MLKTKTLAGIFAGGITIGAATAVTAILLTSNSSLSAMSDREAIESGFETMFECEESQFFNTLDNLNGQSVSISSDFTINELYEESELVGTSFGFLSQTDINEQIANLYGYISFPEYDNDINGTLYFDKNTIAIASNLFSNVIVIPLEEAIEEYNSSDYVDSYGELEISTDELYMILSLCENIVDSPELPQLKADMQTQLNKDIDLLLEHMETVRSDDPEQLNGYNVYSIDADIETSDIINIVYNQIQVILTSDELADYINDSYADYFASIYGSSEDAENINIKATLSAISAYLTFTYADFENTITDCIGDTVSFTMYFTEEAELVRFSTYSIDFSEIAGEDITLTFSIDYLGEDDLLDKTRLTVKLTADDQTIKLEIEKEKTDQGFIATIKPYRNDQCAVYLKIVHSATNTEFNDTLTLSSNFGDLGTITATGTYEITDDKISVDVSELSFKISELVYFDLSWKLEIKKLEESITMPEGNQINLFDMLEDDFADISEQINDSLELDN